MDRIGKELLDNSKAALQRNGLKVDKESLKSKDLLTLLLRANMATDVPEDQKMSDADVLARKFFGSPPACPLNSWLKVRYRGAYLPGCWSRNDKVSVHSLFTVIWKIR